MICKKGVFISLRHNNLRDITYELLSEVCKGVENEPLLQPLTGETLKYQTAKTENNARMDVSALGFWCRDQRAFFDIRVFDPVTKASFGSRVNWIYNPAPPAPRRATLHSGNIPVLASNNEASAIATRGSSGAPLTPSLPKKCRRRRRRQARRAANRNRAPSTAAPVTPDERWANQRTGR